MLISRVFYTNNALTFGLFVALLCVNKFTVQIVNMYLSNQECHVPVDNAVSTGTQVNLSKFRSNMSDCLTAALTTSQIKLLFSNNLMATNGRLLSLLSELQEFIGLLRFESVLSANAAPNCPLNLIPLTVLI